MRYIVSISQTYIRLNSTHWHLNHIFEYLWHISGSSQAYLRVSNWGGRGGGSSAMEVIPPSPRSLNDGIFLLILCYKMSLSSLSVTMKYTIIFNPIVMNWTPWWLSQKLNLCFSNLRWFSIIASRSMFILDKLDNKIMIEQLDLPQIPRFIGLISRPGV